ncbi:hypothetical protein OG417_14440 [Actinoallomurus sp. NBC_01490]|uniref:hypothetical protein n=1 Tax=Actinoallomurus sp. NBC_01490 TaxID=2903557 RepID=UPI002E33E8A1|nr:hypothetical protein [Actinoallomurus sp. NBC_01490]
MNERDEDRPIYSDSGDLTKVYSSEKSATGAAVSVAPQAYAVMATSAATGAARDISQLGGCQA